MSKAGMSKTQSLSKAQRAQLLVAVFVGAALGLRLGLTIFDPGPDQSPDLLVRLERLFSFFTIQSNIAVLLAAIAVLRVRDLETPWMRALRLASMVGITVTCILYIVLLAGDSTSTGLSQVANLMLHYIGPPLAVGAWLIYGPWPALSAGDIPRALLWPALWIAWTLLHGAITDWYPYPFIDISDRGVAPVAISLIIDSVFAVLLSFTYIAAARHRNKQSA